jgi:hypothetical protein
MVGLAGFALAVEIGTVAWYLSPTAGIAFAVSCGVGCAVLIVYHEILGHWWCAPGRPGDDRVVDVEAE